MVEPGEVELLVSPRTLAPGNRLMQGGVLSFHTVEQKIQVARLCEKALFDQMLMTDGDTVLLCVERTRVLDHFQKAKLWQLFLKAQS